MGSIPLVALSVKPVQQPDVLANTTRLEQLRGLQQEEQQRAAMAPYQQQALEQGVQQGQLQLQMQQQALRDQQAFQAAAQDPSNQGKTLGEMADQLRGKVSLNAYLGMKRADIDQQTAYGKLSETQLAATQAAHTQTQQLYDNVMGMDDQTIAQNWQQIAQQYDSIPGNQKMPLNPQQPMTKEQLKNFGPLISMNQSYLDQAQARLKNQADLQSSQAATALKKMQVAQGGTTDSDKFIHNWLQTQGLPDTPANRLKAQKEYINETKVIPQQVRVDAYGKIREYSVFDNKTKTTTWMTPQEINEAKTQEPGRYTVPTYTPEAIGQKGTTSYFTTGKGSQQLTAYNTAMQHLNLLGSLADDLGNSNLQIFNRAAQRWATETGNAAPASFDAAKNAMAGEVASALKASGATDQEISKAESTFSRIQSPAQLHGAIDTYKSLLQSKAKVLQQQYQQGMQGAPNFQNNGVPQQSAPITITLPSGKKVTIE